MMWYSIIGGSVVFFSVALVICNRLWWRGFAQGYECGWRDGKRNHGLTQAEAQHILEEEFVADIIPELDNPEDYH